MAKEGVVIFFVVVGGGGDGGDGGGGGGGGDGAVVVVWQLEHAFCSQHSLHLRSALYLRLAFQSCSDAKKSRLNARRDAADESREAGRP